MSLPEEQGLRPASVRDWQEMFHELYLEPNSWLAVGEIWNRVTEEAGQLAESLRKAELQDLRDGDVLADPLAWLFALANRLGADLTEVTWAKFPGICPYCVVEEVGLSRLAKKNVYATRGGWPVLRECRCPTSNEHTYEEVDPIIEPFRRRRDLQPRSLDEWQSMFKGLYGSRHRIIGTVDTLAFHFVEELGEVAREIRLRDYHACRREMADVFSWILSLATKAGVTIGDFSVDETLWRVYPGVCKRCSDNPCTCRP